MQTPKRTKRVAKLGTIADKVTIKMAKKHLRAQFITTWTPSTIKRLVIDFARTFK